MARELPSLHGHSRRGPGEIRSPGTGGVAPAYTVCVARRKASHGSRPNASSRPCGPITGFARSCGRHWEAKGLPWVAVARWSWGRKGRGMLSRSYGSGKGRGRPCPKALAGLSRAPPGLADGIGGQGHPHPINDQWEKSTTPGWTSTLGPEAQPLKGALAWGRVAHWTRASDRRLQGEKRHRREVGPPGMMRAWKMMVCNLAYGRPGHPERQWITARGTPSPSPTKS